MGNVIEFEAHGKNYPLSIIDEDGRRWVAAQQVGEALGNKNIRMTIRKLVESAEITRDKHYCKLSLHNSTSGNPNKLMLSYRGVIRVMMRSQGSRAREFRDWAEDVLAEVMTTGHYGIDMENAQALQRASLAGLCSGIDIARYLARWDADIEIVAQLAWYRRRGLTQRETATLLEMAVERVQQIEKLMRTAMIQFDPVNVMARARQMQIEFKENIMHLAQSEDTKECREQDIAFLLYTE